MNPVELIMRRRVLGAFIDADPVEIVLTRAGTVSLTAGGGTVRGAPTTLSSQRARIVQAKRRYDNGLINSEAGYIPHTDYLLLGRHTLDIAKDDTFTWRGDTWTVTGIHPTRTESFLCSIDFLGPPNERP
jgi:hypothetical protein